MTAFIKGLKCELGIQWLVADDCQNYVSNNPCVFEVSEEQFGTFYRELIARLSSESEPVKFKNLQDLFEHDRSDVALLPKNPDVFFKNDDYKFCLPEILSWAETKLNMKAYEVSET